jgi:hypothetical protein
VRQRKFRAPRRPPESHRLSRDNGNFLACESALSNFQQYSHAVLFSAEFLAAPTHLLRRVSFGLIQKSRQQVISRKS